MVRLTNRSAANAEGTISTRNPLLNTIWKNIFAINSTHVVGECQEKSGPNRRNCRKCKLQWASKNCTVKNHSATDKENILKEGSNSKATLSGKLKDKNGRFCCENRHCTHRYYYHKDREIPWWVCYKRDCEHHDLMKRKNGSFFLFSSLAITSFTRQLLLGSHLKFSTPASV